MSLPSLDQSFVNGSIQTPVGHVPKVSSSLSWFDHLGTLKARWGIGRMHYIVDPGLYALGKPNEKSLVLVTANYKMSFDRLRESLHGRNVWILVLDTKGINVWCAAGKGTFGTMELVSRIELSCLSQIVTHRELILPQLSGPGVAAHEVKRLSGFKVIYGPIQAKDLTTFLDNGLKATPEMRIKTFTVWERIVLIPIELMTALKAGIIIIPILFLVAYFLGLREGWANGIDYGLLSVLAVLVAILAGAILTPLLLPWLPGRAFSIKGLTIGFISGLILLSFYWGLWITNGGRLQIIAWLFLIPTLSAYIGMNFTGASTYTSLSGVKKEMRWALPLEISGGIIGIILWSGSHFIA